ncbi:putative ribonuclease H-like domain-containing protein [Tanacetum coccineum]|uniref:Ribonuclease H-like domain-containing protein n=1 Tax=Tanacetum coccineum TaxID=301880 RepID=A0ABQ5J774_9ASTR
MILVLSGTNNINTVCPTVNAADIENNVVDENIVYGCIDDPNMPNLEEIVYSDDDEEVGAEADMNNLATTVPVSPIPTTRVHKDHPLEQIIGDIHSAPQTRRMTKNVTEHGMFSSVQQRINHKDFQNCLFACFLSQVEPKKVIQALTDPSWIEAMQDELLQFKLQKVWTLVDLPYGKRAIGTKWVYRNKKDDRGIVVRNKARLVAQGYTQEEGIDYDEVFAPVARIEAIRLFLAYASFMNFIVYQMDVKSAFLYGIIEEEVYVCQPPRFEDPELPNKVYKVYVDDIIFGSTKKSLCTEFKQMMHKRFQMSSIGEFTFFLGLQVKQKDDGIFISQDIYVADILKKFDFATVKTSSTHMETNKELLKDEEAADVDVHLYRSMIGSLMYLTASRLDIMFVVCACASDSPFDLEAFSDSDYAGASLDTKSTTGVNGERQIQALVDKKKVIITKKSVRSDLMLEDAEGTECLLNDEAKNAQAKKIASLKKRFKQLEKRRKSRTLWLKRLRKVGSANNAESSNDVSLGAQEDASKQGRKIDDLDDDLEVTLIDENQERNDEDLMFDTDVLNVTTVGEVVTTANATTIVDGLTLAQTLIEIKAAKLKAIITATTTITTTISCIRPKAKGIIFHDQEERAPVFTPIVSSSQAS